MPTIEIASIDSVSLNLNQDDFRVAILEEHKLRSHRGLFYDDLLMKRGTIIHIGNPEFITERDGGFFAGGIIDWSFIEEGEGESDPQNRFKFELQFKSDIDRLLMIALEKSPVSQVLFLTDYQFGPEQSQTEILNSISDFWSLHDSGGLRFNTLYEMHSP